MRSAINHNTIVSNGDSPCSRCDFAAERIAELLRLRLENDGQALPDVAEFCAAGVARLTAPPRTESPDAMVMTFPHE